MNDPPKLVSSLAAQKLGVSRIAFDKFKEKEAKSNCKLHGLGTFAKSKKTRSR